MPLAQKHFAFASFSRQDVGYSHAHTHTRTHHADIMYQEWQISHSGYELQIKMSQLPMCMIPNKTSIHTLATGCTLLFCAVIHAKYLTTNVICSRQAIFLKYSLSAGSALGLQIWSQDSSNTSLGTCRLPSLRIWHIHLKIDAQVNHIVCMVAWLMCMYSKVRIMHAPAYMHSPTYAFIFVWSCRKQRIATWKSKHNRSHNVLAGAIVTYTDSGLGNTTALNTMHAFLNARLVSPQILTVDHENVSSAMHAYW